MRNSINRVQSIINLLNHTFRDVPISDVLYAAITHSVFILKKKIKKVNKRKKINKTAKRSCYSHNIAFFMAWYILVFSYRLGDYGEKNSVQQANGVRLFRVMKLHQRGSMESLGKGSGPLYPG